MSELQYQTNLEKIMECKVEANKGNPILLPKMLKFLDTEALDSTEMREIGTMYNMSPAQVQGYIRKFQANSKVEDELGTIPTNEYELIDAQLAKWEVKITFDGMFTDTTPYIWEGTLVTREAFDWLEPFRQKQITEADPKTYNLDVMTKKLFKANALLGLKYTEKQLINALDDWIYKRKNKLRSDIFSAIVYDPNIAKSTEDWWDVLVNTITEINVEETKAALKHWIWQVKRKVNGIPVDYHNMIVLVGAQYAGKSSLIKKLATPLLDFSAFTDFVKICDEKNFDLWQNYILIFDEMGRSTHADMETVKRKITEDNFSNRIHHSHNSAKIINKATFIGSSNKAVSRLIIDDTGMRRFYEVECRNTFDWNIVNRIPYEDLWKSIDETQESPLLADKPLFAKVREIQERNRRIGIVEQFLLEYKLVVGVEQRLQATKFFNEFQQFEEQHTARKEYNSTRFGNEVLDVVKRIPWLAMSKTVSKGNTFYKLLKLNEPVSDEE